VYLQNLPILEDHTYCNFFTSSDGSLKIDVVGQNILYFRLYIEIYCYRPIEVRWTHKSPPCLCLLKNHAL